MKREIKFRGLRVDGKGWIYGDLYSGLNELSYINTVVQLNENSRYNKQITVLPQTVGQFTGLKDINGVEIYEGDILSVPDDWDAFGFMSGEKRAVIFKCGAYRLKPKVDTQSGYWLEDDLTFKIIGNIHEA